MHLVVQIVSCILLLDTVRAACHVDCVPPNGSCDLEDEVTCLCEPGYYGTNCQTDGTVDCGTVGTGPCTVPGEVCIDPGVCSSDCAALTCTTGMCVTTGDATSPSRVCKCPATHVGDDCLLACPIDTAACDGVLEKCVPNSVPDAGECVCKLGLTGDCTTVDCSTDNPCLNGVTCDDTTDPDTCVCDTTTQAGVICQHDCTAACDNGGTCVEAASGTDAECSCPSTHVGDMCQFACTCDEDFATCEANAGNTAAVCVCKPGLSGDGCTTVDCSLGNPCLSGGTCVTGTDPDTCRCEATTHSGVICEHACPAACTGTQICSGSNGGTCQDCATACTEHYKECVSGATTPVCSCKLGLSGAECTTVICADGDPCQNDGTCVNDACTCDTTTYTGDLCQLECTEVCTAPEICSGSSAPTCLGCATACAEHYEECVAGDAAPECECRAGLSGTDCLTISCTAGDPCLNGGTCETNACSCNTTLSAGDICQFACTDECAEGQTCEEGDGVGTCSGATTVLASMVLLLTTLARRLF